jgi:hypothetical protein
MDNILSAIGRLIGKLLGRNLDCGLDCDISDLTWPEYLLLSVVFIVVFIISKKILHTYKK